MKIHDEDLDDILRKIDWKHTTNIRIRFTEERLRNTRNPFKRYALKKEIKQLRDLIE